MPDQPALRDALRDLVADVEAGDELRQRIEQHRAANRRPLLLVAAAIVVALAVGAAVLVAAHDDRKPPLVTVPRPSGEGWQPLAPAPMAPRTGASVVWTGKEVLVWGGTQTGRGGEDDGAAYDPATNRWRAIPSAPIGGRFDAATAWTGSELLVWGGSVGSAATPADGDGAAYDPLRNRWRKLPASPLAARQNMASAWTDTELVIWGGETHEGDAADGAAYDPATDTWRRLPAMGLPGGPASAVSDAGELVIRSNRTGASAHVIGPAQVVEALAGLPADGRDGAAMVAAGIVPIVWGGASSTWHADGWELVDYAWRPMPAAPPTSTDYHELHGVWTGGHVVLWPDELSYDQRAHTWARLPKAPLATERPLAVVAVDGKVLVWSAGTAAGSTVPGVALTVDAPRPTYAPPRGGCGDVTQVSVTAMPPGWDAAATATSGGGVRWRGPGDAAVELRTGRGPGPDRNIEDIEALGSRGTLGSSPGASVATLDCGVTFTGHGMNLDEFRRLVTGAVGIGPQGSRDARGFALWPEVTPSAAVQASRRLVTGTDTWRLDPQQTAVRFATTVLGWRDARASGPPGVDGVVHVNDGRHPADVVVERLVGGTWWSVTSVSTFGEGGFDPSVGVNPKGADFGFSQVGTSASVHIAYWRGDASPSEADLLVPPLTRVHFASGDLSQPGAVLTEFKDASGAVLHAWGFVLPSGQFAAG